MLLEIMQGAVTQIAASTLVTGIAVDGNWLWFRTSRSRALPLSVGDQIAVVGARTQPERALVALRFRRQLDGCTFAPHQHSSIPLQIAASLLLNAHSRRSRRGPAFARRVMTPLLALGAVHLNEQTLLVSGFAAQHAAKTRNAPVTTSSVEQTGTQTPRVAVGLQGAEPSPENPWWHSELLEFTQDAIIIWEMDGAGILYWNQAAEQLYGYTREEAQGKVTHDLLRTVTRKPVKELELILARYGVWVGELRHTTRTGQTVDVEGRLSLMSQRNGRWLVLEVNRDVTDRRRADAAGAAREASMSTLTRSR